MGVGMDNPNIKIAMDMQKRFEFYLIALIFTILGLTLQTAVLIKEYYQYVFEILSWIFLMLSGLTGLSRLEWIPVLYKICANIQTEEGNKELLEQAENDEMPFADEIEDPRSKDQLLKKTEESIRSEKEKQNKLEAKTLLKYKLHKLFFILGLLSLMASRAILGLSKLFK